MHLNRLTAARILAILHESEAGRTVEVLCRAHGIVKHTPYRWKAKCRELKLEAKWLRQRALACAHGQERLRAAE